MPRYQKDCENCGEVVRRTLPVAETYNDNYGIRVRCRDCGAINFIPYDKQVSSNDQREAIQE